MSQSEYYARGAGVTLAYDTGEREDDALERLEWVVPAAFVGAALILWVALLEWLAPMVPVLLFVGLVWTPLSLVVLFKSGDQVRPGALAGALGLLMLFGIPLMAWNADGYRANMLLVVDRMTPVEVTMRAVEDPSDTVAEAACTRQLMDADLGQILELSTLLETRPEVAVECLRDVEKQQRGTAARVAAELVDSWYRGWMTETQLDERLVCSQARHTGELASVFGSDGRAELLMCRFNADDDVVAACCGKGASEYARNHGVLDVDPDRWLRSLHVPLFEKLMEVTELPRSTLRGDNPLDESLAWSAADLWHWTIRIGCHLLTVESDAEGVARNLSEMTNRQCGVDTGDPMRSVAAFRSIGQACKDMADNEGRIEVDDWCLATEEASRDSAVVVAKLAVYRARRSFDVEEILELVQRGLEVVEELDDRTPVVSRNEIAGPEIDRRFETPDQRRLPSTWSRGGREAEEDLEEMTRRHHRRRQQMRAELEEETEGGDDDRRPAEIDRAVGDEIRQELDAFRDEFEEMDFSDADDSE